MFKMINNMKKMQKMSHYAIALMIVGLFSIHLNEVFAQEIKVSDETIRLFNKEVDNYNAESILFDTNATIRYYLLGIADTVLPNNIELFWQPITDGDILTGKEKDILLESLIYNQYNYLQDLVRISGTYDPNILFVFSNKKGEVSVLVSQSDKTWTILYKGKRIYNNRYASALNIDDIIGQYIKD